MKISIKTKALDMQLSGSTKQIYYLCDMLKVLMRESRKGE